MKTLIFCPTGPRGYGWRAAIAAIKRVEGGDLVLHRDNPHECAGWNILHNYRAGRRLALEGGYDALLTIESDVIPPPDALTVLADLPADVAYGLYCFRRDDFEWNLHQPTGGRYFGPSYSRRGLAPTFYGRVVEVSGLGLGCTLIHRRVLERIDFRLDPGVGAAPDFFFAVDARRAGFKQVGHAGVLCGHIRHEEPAVLWPATNDRGFEIKSLRDKRRY